MVEEKFGNWEPDIVTHWWCKCDNCGREVSVPYEDLISENITCCGLCDTPLKENEPRYYMDRCEHCGKVMLYSEADLMKATPENPARPIMEVKEENVQKGE